MGYFNNRPGSIEEIAKQMSKHQNESGYQDMFKKELEKTGKGIGAMTPAEKKAFQDLCCYLYLSRKSQSVRTRGFHVDE